MYIIVVGLGGIGRNLAKLAVEPAAPEQTNQKISGLMPRARPARAPVAG